MKYEKYLKEVLFSYVKEISKILFDNELDFRKFNENVEDDYIVFDTIYSYFAYNADYPIEQVLPALNINGTSELIEFYNDFLESEALLV